MRNSYILLCSLTSFVGASTCPFYGQAFPAPKQLAADAAFQGSIEALEASITQAIISGNDTFGPIKANDTYSIQIFSTQDKKPLSDFHRRGPNIVGDRPIDGDSIYRIGSVTKLYTVYLLLLHLGDGVFEDPVTKYLPELSGKGNWDEIRVGAVAGFISGITAESKQYYLINPFMDIDRATSVWRGPPERRIIWSISGCIPRFGPK